MVIFINSKKKIADSADTSGNVSGIESQTVEWEEIVPVMSIEKTNYSDDLS
jgi:hypothetical protein